jgi:hypothetical protein
MFFSSTMLNPPCCSIRCSRKLQQQTLARAKAPQTEHISAVQRRQERRSRQSIEEPDERQVAAYLAAGEQERRLFEPYIAIAAHRRMNSAEFRK